MMRPRRGNNLQPAELVQFSDDETVGGGGHVRLYRRRLWASGVRSVGVSFKVRLASTLRLLLLSLLLTKLQLGLMGKTDPLLSNGCRIKDPLGAAHAASPA